ncbi:MAG: bacteriohemerythrin [Deltaproteobacteria bacterium]|nr:bacteriohemerythrin [Deltaproteobacteria bacterium]
MKIEFSKDLETGVQWQDKQHLELIQKVEALLNAVEAHADMATTIKFLDFLDDYAVVHFHDEEKAMSDTSFAESVAHTEEHHHFIEEISDIRKRLESGGNFDMEHLKTHIFDWLANHISVEDKKLGRHILKS